MLVNIFGGIMKCDIIAAALLAAYDEIDFRVPLVVRLEGTNVDLGKALSRRAAARSSRRTASPTRPERSSPRQEGVRPRFSEVFPW